MYLYTLLRSRYARAPLFALLGFLPLYAPTIEPAPPQHIVAEAPIWGQNNGANGYAFLPVTIHNHKGTVVINLNCTKCDLSLSVAALAKIGVTLADSSATTLDAITIGASDVQRAVPLAVITKPTWHVPGPDSLPPVVGIVGVHFISTRYDLLYDFPARRVTLYALPPHHPLPASKAWLPAGFTPSDCGKMIDVPPGAGTFTGVEMQIDGHPVAGVLEMGPYMPKMDASAFQTLHLSSNSPRVRPPIIPTDGGHVAEALVQGVHMTVGTHTFGTWNTEVLHELDVQSLLPSKPPVMLMNLSMLNQVRLFNAISSQQVCISDGNNQR